MDLMKVYVSLTCTRSSFKISCVRSASGIPMGGPGLGNGDSPTAARSASTRTLASMACEMPWTTKPHTRQNSLSVGPPYTGKELREGERGKTSYLRWMRSR